MNRAVFIKYEQRISLCQEFELLVLKKVDEVGEFTTFSVVEHDRKVPEMIMAVILGQVN